MIKKNFFIVLLFAAQLAFLPYLNATTDPPQALAGGPDTVRLKGEASVLGKILKEDEKVVVIDLGYDVLVIPQSEVLEIKRQKETLQEAQESTPAPADTLLSLTQKPTAAGGREKSVKEVVDLYENSVVVISNPKGWGTGFIVTEDGYCLTNHHVISGERKNTITIFTKSGLGDQDESVERKRIEEVEIVAFNRYFDLALLKIKDEALEGLELTVASFGDEDKLQTGDQVVAIGNPGAVTWEKEGFQRQVWHHTVSEGIVSSKARNIRGILYIQTTAAVNPGNSGGPLLNIHGQVVGIVTLKSYFQENIAFAVPVNYIRDFIKNRTAFAFGKDNPNLGYRYLAPPRRKQIADAPEPLRRAEKLPEDSAQTAEINEEEPSEKRQEEGGKL
jgi:serine protease Do